MGTKVTSVRLVVTQQKEKYEYLNCKLIRKTGEEIISIFKQMELIEKNEKTLYNNKIENLISYEDIKSKVHKKEINQVEFKINNNEY